MIRGESDREREEAGMRARTGILARAGAGLIFAAAVAPARAASFDFVPAPQADLNRIYRIDRVTGEVSSCQYALQEGTVGITLCAGPGEGAGPQPPGEYGLVATRHVREAGVFRVNYRTGDMSICYVLGDQVVCTPQTNPGPGTAATAPPPGLRPPPTPGAPQASQR